VSAAADRPLLTCNGCSRRVQFDPDIDFPCTGARPWLPHAGAEACTARAKPIERTSTTAYYAWQMSSLTIPVAGADNPALLHALTDNATLRTLRRLTRTPEIVSNITGVATRLGIHTATRRSPATSRAQARPRRRPKPRRRIVRAVVRGPPRRTTGALPDLIVEPQDIEEYRNSRLGRMLSAVSLVPAFGDPRARRLSRIEPSPADPEAGYAQLWGSPVRRRSRSSPTTTGCPATRSSAKACCVCSTRPRLARGPRGFARTRGL